jgi:hypothetical protein
MKKFLLTAAVAILALGALAFPAAAQDTDLTTMAQYLPADAPIYFGFRTDEAFIDEVDSFVDKLGPMVPMSFREALDGVAGDAIPGGTFETTFRSWLGDQAAIGVYDLQGQSAEHPVPPVTIALAVTDREEAEAFFATMPNAERYTTETEGDYTLYTPDSTMTSDPYYVFRDDVLLITGDASLAEAGGVLEADERLSDNPAFGTALELLPADQYSGIVYVDTPAIYGMMMTDMPMRGMGSSNEAAMEMVMGMVDALQPQAFGLTMLDDRTLAVDFASPINADAAGPFVLNMSTAPIDPAFAGHLPANTPFVVQGTDLYSSYQNGLANLEVLVNMIPESQQEDRQNFELALWGLGFFVRGLTGMEVDDALGWMTGDYAMSLGFSPAFTDSTSIFSAMMSNPVEFGVTIAVGDEDKAQAFFDGLTRSLSGLPVDEVSITQETLPGGTPALSISIAAPDVPFPIELMAAVGDGVFSFGTPRTVTAAVEPQQGGGLSSDASYTEAWGYALENANALLFLSSDNLLPIAKLMTAEDNPESIREQGKQVRAFLDLFSSASISTSALPDNGGSLARIVWTLPE